MYTPLALIASCFFSLIQLSFTAPIVESRAATQFYLQTSVINGTKDTGSKKGGLYVYAFHTGAGLNDAVLSSNKTIASKGSLNGTDLTFALAGSTLTWNATLSSDTNNAGWEPVQIDAAEEATPAFAVNGTNLVAAVEYDFGGWLACDWSHGKPQLFYLVSGYKAYQVIPSSCSTVDLKVVAV